MYVFFRNIVALSRHYAVAALMMLSFCNVSWSQVPEGYPVVTATDLPGAKFSSPRVFTGSSLFGYMNGGAELYLEYGVSGAVITEITMKDGKYKTEVFKMNGPEEAFGIFSVSRYRCTGRPDVSDFSCQTKYQVQYSKGPYYISIINGTGTISDSINMLTIGRIIADKIKEPVFDPGTHMPGISKNLVASNCFLAKGRLGIINGLPDLEDYFKGVAGYSALVLNDTGKIIISVRFRDKEIFKDFLISHNWNTDDQGSEPVSTGNEAVRLIDQNHLLIEL